MSVQAELEFVTRGKAFVIRHEPMWQMLVASYDMIIVDLASWALGFYETGGGGFLRSLRGPDRPRAPTLALTPSGAYSVHMSGPSTKPRREEPSYAPHPDDAEALREGLEAAERGDALSPEESAAYVRKLLGDEPQKR